MSEQTEFEFYSTKALAKLLDINPNWLNHNRKSSNSIPFKKLGRYIRYKSSDVQTWIGAPNLTLNFFSTKTLAKKLDVSVDVLKHNRSSKNSIPFHRLGNLVRYQQNEVLAWIEKNRL